jgi:translation initiation factor 2 beta subunit (eIF-2beta)/eIF-5
LSRLGTKKTVIKNFLKLCGQMNRHPEHVMSFFKQ